MSTIVEDSSPSIPLRLRSRIQLYKRRPSPVTTNKPDTPPRTVHVPRLYCSLHTHETHPRMGKAFSCLSFLSFSFKQALNPPCGGAGGFPDFPKISQKFASVIEDLPRKNLPLIQRKHGSPPMYITCAAPRLGAGLLSYSGVAQ